MRKLNNKGMTTAEILVSFILVAMISATIYTTVSNYNVRRELESNKLEINTYKNLLTKEIQDDLIKKGLVKVTKRDFQEENVDVFVVDFELKDRTTKRLVVKRQLADNYFISPDNTDASDLRYYNDYFTIFYGTPTTNITTNSTLTNNLIEYPMPDFGYGMNHEKYGSDVNKYKVKDFRLTTVIIKTDNNTLSLFIGFDHLQLATRYAINIVCPINYTT